MFAGDSEYQQSFDRIYKSITGRCSLQVPADKSPAYDAAVSETSDPDILAKLYESSIDASDKKSSGTYYTPPEVVRFMCRDVLTHYLSNSTGLSYDDMHSLISKITAGTAAGRQHSISTDIIKAADKALEDIRIFDPSTGCGAFATGILDEIVRLRAAMTEYIRPGSSEYKTRRIERHPFVLKLNAIARSIYGADIDPVAVEITRLRLWNDLYKEFERYRAEAGAPADIQEKDKAENCTPAEGRNIAYSAGELAHMPGYGGFKCNIICSDSLLEYEAGGFDAVIGNPPYISAVAAAKRGWDMRQTVKKKFPQLKGAFDIYAAFLLDGIRKTNEKGVYCWIVPNKLLVSQYAAPVLEYLKQNGLRYSISVSDIGVFSGVGVYPIIITGNRYQTGNGEMPVPSERYSEYSADSLQNLAGRCFVIRPEMKKYETFADHNIKISSGAAGFQAAALKQYITQDPDAGDSGVSDGSRIPFIVSGAIDKYRIRHDSIRYMGTTYKRPYISKGEKIADNKWELWNREKICIAGLTKELEAYYSKKPLALGVGVYAIYGFGGYDPLCLLGLINSKFMSWYVSVKFHEKHLSENYLAINKYTLEQLPLAKADGDLQAAIACRAEKLLQILNTGSSARNGIAEAEQLLAEIDELVYMMYQLDDKEIDMIRKHFE